MSKKKTKNEPEDSHATLLVALALQGGVTLWHDAETKDAYATIPVDDHFENWPLKSRAMKCWLGAEFYKRNDQAAHAQALTDALSVLEGRAVYEGEGREVHVRVAYVAAENATYVDLGDDTWRAVRIGSDGWKIVNQPPVKFRRSRGLKPLPTPLRGGNLAELETFLNVPNREAFILMVAWLLSCFMPEGPYPVLDVDGEQGSAKSTACRLLRKLVDPNKALLRSQPREERDLAIAGNNGRVIGFDNISGLPDWLSDALCRVSTGAGLATRELYTDSDEVIFSGARPIIANGIGGVASRPDLLDRTVRITLPPIPGEKRQDEKTFWAKFDAKAPGILGALFDAVSAAMKNQRDIQLKSAPRMADFARWVVAAEPALPWDCGAFLEAYCGNRSAANADVLESSLLASIMIPWIHSECDWEGSMKDLLEKLKVLAKGAADAKEWPKSPKSLGVALRRIGPNLRAVGLDVRFEVSLGRGTGKRKGLRIRLAGVGEPSGGEAEAETKVADGVRLDVDGVRPPEANAPTKNPAGTIENAVGADGVHGAAKIHPSHLAWAQV